MPPHQPTRQVGDRWPSHAGPPPAALPGRFADRSYPTVECEQQRHAVAARHRRPEARPPRPSRADSHPTAEECHRGRRAPADKAASRSRCLTRSLGGAVADRHAALGAFLSGSANAARWSQGSQLLQIQRALCSEPDHRHPCSDGPVCLVADEAVIPFQSRSSPRPPSTWASRSRREVLRLLADLRCRRRRLLALKVAGYSNPEVMKILSVAHTKVRGNGPSWVNTGWVGPSPARKML